MNEITTVLVRGMDSRKLATLRAAFKSHTQQRYQLLDDATGNIPQVALIEMDGVDAKHLWKEFRNQYPQLPAIMVSAFPQPGAPVPVLMKPIQLEKLFAILQRALSQPGTVPIDSPSEPITLKKAILADPQITSPGITPQDVSENPPRVQQFNLPETIEYFDTRHGLLSVLLEIKKQNTATMIKIAGQIALIAVPQNKKIFPLISMSIIQASCLNPSEKIATLAFTTGVYPKNIEPINFSSLLWQVSLWTSHGRLLNGINPNTLLRLRHWPNLTRLAEIPDAMRIAALWTRHPANLQLTVRMLNIPPQHIFDFLAASYSIGILDFPESPGETPIDITQSTPTQPRGGLLMRLLRKIAGIK